MGVGKETNLCDFAQWDSHHVLLRLLVVGCMPHLCVWCVLLCVCVFVCVCVCVCLRARYNLAGVRFVTKIHWNLLA